MQSSKEIKKKMKVHQNGAFLGIGRELSIKMEKEKEIKGRSMPIVEKIAKNKNEYKLKDEVIESLERFKHKICFNEGKGQS